LFSFAIRSVFSLNLLHRSQDMNALDAARRMKADEIVAFLSSVSAPPSDEEEPADPAILAMPGDDAAKVRSPSTLHCPPASLPLFSMLCAAA
jgi:hypothetical protein